METKKLGKPAKYGKAMTEIMLIRFTKDDLKLIVSKAKQAGYINHENGASSFARDLLLKEMNK